MIYTYRIAHLLERPKYTIGSVIKRGDKIGTMGASGPEGTETHIHGDCVEGEQSGHYTLEMMEAGNPKPAIRQLNHFIDAEAFGIEPFITTYYGDIEYMVKRKKLHLAYDFVPVDRHKTKVHHHIYWNRSYPGLVTRIAYDPIGYGHYICIAYEVPKED